MNKYRYYLPPRSKFPAIVGVLAALFCLNTVYTLISMPHYTQYWDYWATLAASLLLSIICFVFARRKTELLLIPTGMLALIACLTPSLVHWMEVGLFFLLLFQMLFRLPKAVAIAFRIIGVGLTGVGVFVTLQPMLQRIQMLSAAGRATAEFVVPFVIRTLGDDILCLLSLLLLVFSMQPHRMPGWMDSGDQYDRIWE